MEDVNISRRMFTTIRSNFLVEANTIFTPLRVTVACSSIQALVTVLRVFFPYSLLPRGNNFLVRSQRVHRAVCLSTFELVTFPFARHRIIST